MEQQDYNFGKLVLEEIDREMKRKQNPARVAFEQLIDAFNEAISATWKLIKHRIEFLIEDIRDALHK